MNELGRIMFENSVDAADTFLECKNFDTVADQILSFLMSEKLLHPQLQQYDVIRWVEFEQQKPNYNTYVILRRPDTEHMAIVRWCKEIEGMFHHGYTCWYPVPPIV